MTDAPSRVERVLNLLALMLDTQVPRTREEFVREIAGYPAQPEANRRAFERDKEILRGMGVPITMETIGDGTEVGYRVRPDDYCLPDLGLTADETAALRVAVSAISLGDRTGHGRADEARRRRRPHGRRRSRRCRSRPRSRRCSRRSGTARS